MKLFHEDFGEVRSCVDGLPGDGAGPGALGRPWGNPRRDHGLRFICMVDPKTTVEILPDRGERYLETLFSDDWVREHLGEVHSLWRDAGVSP